MRSVRRLAILAAVVVLPAPCRPTSMIATGAGALRSMDWLSPPSVSISESWTILTTIWPGLIDLTTAAPIALVRVRSMKERTTSSATSASSSARRTSRIAALTSSSESAPRPVSLSNMPESFSERLSNIASLQRFDVGTAQRRLRPGARRAAGREPPASKGRSAYRRGGA